MLYHVLHFRHSSRDVCWFRMYKFVQALYPSLVVSVGMFTRASMCYHIRYAQNNFFWFASDVSFSVYIRFKVIMMYSKLCAYILLYLLKLCGVPSR